MILAVLALAPPPPAEARPPAGALDGAVSVSMVFEKDLGGNTDLYVIPVGGGAERRLTRHPARDILPRWSADGSRIYFSTERSGHWQVYEVEESGGEPRLVTMAPDPGCRAIRPLMGRYWRSFRSSRATMPW